ncbi:Uma2 family endonuclease [Chitinophaga agrisoli]|uniref:Uma2 family endonuclease n=2 Tax=Chitinophaga agrisoli TaxID=2607653 RepID=A0A5B2VZU2_9BACT|nr:Uma2 family endonuclease [Chitinophaga agrisoli]
MPKPISTIPPRTMMEVFEYLPEGTLVQLIENILIMSPAPTTNHQRMLAKIYKVMAIFVDDHDLGEVWISPLDVYLDDENAFQPDIIFISKARQSIVKKKGIYGAQDLVIEILSPSTGKYDRRQKKDVYERCGVQEYWIIDPYEKSVQGFQLVNNKYKALAQTEGFIRSGLLQTEFHF